MFNIWAIDYKKSDRPNVVKLVATDLDGDSRGAIYRYLDSEDFDLAYVSIRLLMYSELPLPVVEVS